MTRQPRPSRLGEDNAYVTKPINHDDFTTVVAWIDEFFAQVAALPTAS